MTLNSLEYIKDININTENILVFVNNARMMMTWQNKSVSQVTEARVTYIHIFYVQCLFETSLSIFVFCVVHVV